MDVIAENQYGNGVAVFTEMEAQPDNFKNVQAGMVGINVPIPVPVGYHSFGGWDDSLFGDSNVWPEECVSIRSKSYHKSLA